MVSSKKIVSQFTRMGSVKSLTVKMYDVSDVCAF